ncbi:hypothetical protein ACQUYM_30580, partial [Pseudomonas paraeruginosa]|uniref:hypothetical protein n=1 Tax=Pseudomonas paraeruginosa TaxID=2994495 RepID=UPI003FD413AF
LEGSGSQAQIDVPGQASVLLAGDGGRIALSSYNGLYLDGSLRAAAGGAGAAGGSLEVIADAPLYQGSTVTDDSVLAMRELVLTAGHADSGLSTLLRPGMDDSALRYGQSRVGTQSLTSGGFDQLSLFSNGPLSFEGSIDLAMGRSLNLYAGTIAAAGGGLGEVKLQAPYIRLSGVGMYAQQPFG